MTTIQSALSNQQTKSPPSRKMTASGAGRADIIANSQRRALRRRRHLHGGKLTKHRVRRCWGHFIADAVAGGRTAINHQMTICHRRHDIAFRQASSPRNIAVASPISPYGDVANSRRCHQMPRAGQMPHWQTSAASCLALTSQSA